MRVHWVRQIVSREWSLTGCSDSVFWSKAFQRLSSQGFPNIWSWSCLSGHQFCQLGDRSSGVSRWRRTDVHQCVGVGDGWYSRCNLHHTDHVQSYAQHTVDWSRVAYRDGIQWTLTTSLEDLDFADDIALLSHDHQGMQAKVTQFAKISAKTGLRISNSKTKVVRVKKGP